jgi:NADH-quinone oxidoreductase subunit N
MFSLAGIPPLWFYSKYVVIHAVVQSEQYILLSLALGAAVVSAFYYCRVVKLCILHQVQSKLVQYANT